MAKKIACLSHFSNTPLAGIPFATLGNIRMKVMRIGEDAALISMASLLIIFLDAP